MKKIISVIFFLAVSINVACAQEVGMAQIYDKTTIHMETDKGVLTVKRQKDKAKVVEIIFDRRQASIRDLYDKKSSVVTLRFTRTDGFETFKSFILQNGDNVGSCSPLQGGFVCGVYILQ